MWFGLRQKAPKRREPRAAAFRSRDLVRELRPHLAAFLKERHFKRLGEQSWVADLAGTYLIVAVQARRSGWEDRAGGRFVVEFELTSLPVRGTGFRHERLWRLLDAQQRESVLSMNDAVARSLPKPNPRFLAQLGPEVKAHYLLQFQPMKPSTGQIDAWFQYYDESDAAIWGAFLAEVLPLAMTRFLSEADRPNDDPVN